MRALVVRTGVTEAVHQIDAVVVDATGHRLAVWGDPDHVLYYRSAIKPVQAAVSQENGAGLCPEHLAVACASHGGFPVHLATVRVMLDEVGLSETDLGTTPGWPSEAAARDLQVRNGHRSPRRVFHNCSGKHAGFLRACVASGWPIDSYRSPDHPLQRRIEERVRELTGVEPAPAAIDGCGAPAFRGTLAGLALGFARLSSDPAYRAVASAMHRFPGLVAGARRPDARMSRWWHGPLKAGAEGIMAAGARGIGYAVKSRSGSGQIAAVGMLEVMGHLGALSPAAMHALGEVARPPVLGGGSIQGWIGSTTETDPWPTAI
jgi:L-asparaginase II